MLKENHWFNGPEFLSHGDIDYDSVCRNCIFDDFGASFSGRNLENLEEASSCLTVKVVNVDSPVLETLLKKFSSYDKSLRYIAFVQRFVYNLRQKVRKEDLILDSNVSTQEYITKLRRRWLNTFNPN